MNQVFNMDCVEGSKKHLKDNSVDLVITDPPYGINGDQLHKHYNRKESFVVDGYVEVESEKYEEFCKGWIPEIERVLKPGGSVYIVSGYSNLHHILNALHTTDLTEVNHIIWKYNFGVHTTRKYVSSHYHILYWTKKGSRPTFNTYSRFGSEEKSDGNGSLNYLDREDVWLINREYKPGQEKNKNELPKSLLTKIIQYSSNENDLICDFFLGGFSTATVAKSLNRNYCGFELSKSAFESGSRRLTDTGLGSAISALRSPNNDVRENRGKTWTEGEIDIVMKAVINAKRDKIAKTRLIADLQNKLGRGRFAIMNQIEKVEKEISERSDGQKVMDQFLG